MDRVLHRSAGHGEVRPMAQATYSVAVLGFGATERLVLGSIFTLSSRRDPRYQFCDEDSTPDVFLADADDDAAMAQLGRQDPSLRIPVVLVGLTDRGTGYPLVSRPLQWTRLFERLDEQCAPGLAARSFEADAARGLPEVPLQRPDRVLLADGDPVRRDFVRARLSLLRLPFDIATTGEDALAFSSTRTYGCVFLAASLPGVDGFDVCRILKTRKERGPTPVVILASKTSTAARLRAKFAGSDDVLLDPIDEADLYAALVRYLPLNVSG